MAYASPSDVQDRYIGRTFDSDELSIISTRLDDAELILKTRIPDLDTRVNENQTFHDLIVMIECEMVLRLIKNPDGYTQETDGNYSYSVSARVASGRLDVLGSEWALLGVRGGAYVISTLPPAPWGV